MSGVDISGILKGDLGEGTWYRIQGTEDASVKIKPMTPKRRDALRKKHTRFQVKKGIQIDITNDPALMADYVREVVVDWKGLTQPNEAGNGQEPVPFSQATAVILAENWNELSILINSVVLEQVEMAAQIEELDEGNSEAGPSST